MDQKGLAPKISISAVSIVINPRGTLQQFYCERLSLTIISFPDSDANASKNG